MSEREWKPGMVAAIGGGNPITFYENEDTSEVMFTNAHGYQHSARHLHPSARPLVVIDPEDREAVERLADMVTQQISDRDRSERVTAALVAALREYANPKPLRPDEPQGLGAVVEAIYDNRFVHVGNGGWQRVEKGDRQGQICTYAEVAAVRVLSPGVEIEVRS